jgi:hypothetical protein
MTSLADKLKEKRKSMNLKGFTIKNLQDQDNSNIDEENRILRL